MVTDVIAKRREYNRINMKARRDRFRAQNLCGNCGAEVVPGKTQCKKHLRLNVTSGRLLRLNRKALGLCIHCGEDISHIPLKRQQCQQCCDKIKANYRERTDERTCSQCGGASIYLATCSACNLQERLQARYLVQNNLCRICEVAPAYKQYDKCQECVKGFLQARTQRLKSEGVCLQCRVAKVQNVSVCDTCRDIALKNGASLRKQRYALGQCSKCPDERLPGKTLCLRHNKINNEDARRRYYRRKAQALCVHCGESSEGNGVYCKTCTVRWR